MTLLIDIYFNKQGGSPLEIGSLQRGPLEIGSHPIGSGVASDPIGRGFRMVESLCGVFLDSWIPFGRVPWQLGLISKDPRQSGTFGKGHCQLFSRQRVVPQLVKYKGIQEDFSIFFQLSNGKTFPK